MNRFINLEDRVYIDTNDIVCVEFTPLDSEKSEVVITLRNGTQIETNFANATVVTQLKTWLAV